MKKPIHIFEAYGIELEYMIVDTETLKVRPISDRLLQRVSGDLTGDYENGSISWSNELVLHVIELKTTGPEPDLKVLAPAFQKNIERINDLLKSESACLLPTGMHPFMDPLTEKKLWPHDNNEVYEAYDRIFDCRGHGWSNLQSMHINLPFANDDEFRKLHTAIRFLLPILPSLTASSPIVDNRVSGDADSRLVFYQQNQKRVPSITGQVIPEPVLSKSEYFEQILSKTYSDIEPFDPEELLRDDWLNSRGAIARFGRQTIEIRILDTQECPSMDLAIAELIVTLLKLLCSESSIKFETQLSPSTQTLKKIFDACVHSAETAVISDSDYLSAWRLPPTPITAQNFWQTVWTNFNLPASLSPEANKHLSNLIRSGSLSTRILKALPSTPNPDSIKSIYENLVRCLATNSFFQPQSQTRTPEINV